MAHVADTIPYPWPYDGTVDPSHLALIVTGAQARWSALDDGTLAVIGQLADTLRVLDVLVVHVRHARPGQAGRPGRDLPERGEPDWELALPTARGDLVIDTPAHDAFLSGWLDVELRARRRTHLLLTGLGAEVMADSTLRSANDRGYECLTLVDATVPFDPVTGARALASITMSGGIFGAVGSTAAVLAALGAPAAEEITS
jgi:nicotinamidase-related amidase